MRKLFEDLRTRVDAFVEQRDDLALIVSAGPREHVALTKVLETMDEGASRHVFWIFTEPFSTATQYAGAIGKRAQLRYDALTAALDSEAAARFPMFPAAVLDAGRPAEQRLRELLLFARSLLPNLDEQHLVAAFLPQTIDHVDGYARLFDALLEHRFPFPWCHHIRVVLRDDPAKPALASKPVRRRTRLYSPDLSDTALERALEAEANAVGAPIEQRMQALLVLAGIDSSHRRTPAALEKYELLANYHCKLGNLPALALALNGMGEACAIAERSDEARRHFERALTPAIDAQDLPTLTSITFNLARLHQDQRAWALAIEYYDGLSTLAKASLNASLQLICHEQRGICQHESGQVDRALEEWRAGDVLSEGVGMLDQRLMFLRRRVDLLARQGRSQELPELQRQMSELRRGGAQELPL